MYHVVVRCGGKVFYDHKCWGGVQDAAADVSRLLNDGVGKNDDNVSIAIEWRKE